MLHTLGNLVPLLQSVALLIVFVSTIINLAFKFTIHLQNEVFSLSSWSAINLPLGEMASIVIIIRRDIHYLCAQLVISQHCH